MARQWYLVFGFLSLNLAEIGSQEKCEDGQCEYFALVQRTWRPNVSGESTLLSEMLVEQRQPAQIEGAPHRSSLVEQMFSPHSAPKRTTHIDFQKQEELDEHRIAKFIILPVGAALITALVAAGVLEKFHISWLPESAIVVCIGMALGYVMHLHLGETDLFTTDTFHETCAILLNLFLLPLIIFESGWSLKSRDFASQLVYIILFAVVGTMISFAIVGLGIMYTGRLGLHSVVMARTAFAYASLIAATDPVATLSTYTKLRVDPLLSIMVFGDSTLNDAVAIVLFKTMNDDSIMAGVERDDLGSLALKMAGKMFSLFAGSFAVGFGFAVVFLVTLRFAGMNGTPHLEILSLVVSAYLSFAIAEVVGMSGIISCFVCSIFLGIYARNHLSYHGSLLGSFVLKRLATLMDICVFLLAGVCVVDLHRKGFVFAMWAILACLVARFTAVFSIGHVVNTLKRYTGKSMDRDEEDCHLLPSGHLFMLWHAGLRGAIALTLSMQMGPWVDQLEGAGTRKTLQTATFVIVLFFLIFFGGSTEYMLQKCQVPINVPSNAGQLWCTEVGQRTQTWFAWIDEALLAPLLLGPNPHRDPSVDDEDLKDVDVMDLLNTVDRSEGKLDIATASRQTLKM